MEEETKKRIGSMYETINPVTVACRTYPIVFLARRTTFVILTFLFFDYPALQITL